jgi:hypothetical protein
MSAIAPSKKTAKLVTQLSPAGLASLAGNLEESIKTKILLILPRVERRAVSSKPPNATTIYPLPSFSIPIQ